MSHLDPVSLARLQFAATALYHFSVRAADARTVLPAGHHGERLCDDRPRNLARRDTVLGKIVRHQFRHGGRHRHHHGIPVRHQLGLLLALCRRHFRRAARHRRPHGLLSGIDLRRPVLLRLGPPAEARPSDGDLAGRHRLQFVRSVDFDRQRLDAAPDRRRLQPRHHAHGAHFVLGFDLQSGGAGQIRPHGRRRLCHRLDVRRGDLVLLPAFRPIHGFRQALDHRRVGLWACGRVLRRHSRRRERLHGFRKPEDETRGHRGHVENRAGAGEVSILSAFPTLPSTGSTYDIKIPWALGIIATRSFDEQIPGIDDLVARNAQRIRSGLIAYDALETFKANRTDSQARAQLARSCRRSRLCAFAQALCRRSAHRRRRHHRQGRRQYGSRHRHAVLELPHHGGARLLFHRLLRAVVLGCVAPQFLAHVGCCGWRCGRCRCLGSRPSSVGSSPNTAASHGRSTACCRRFWPHPRSRPRRSCSPCAALSCSIRRCLSSTSC